MKNQLYKIKQQENTKSNRENCIQGQQYKACGYTRTPPHSPKILYLSEKYHAQISNIFYKAWRFTHLDRLL